MKRFLFATLMALLTLAPVFAQHNAGHNGKVLMILSNKAVSQHAVCRGSGQVPGDHPRDQLSRAES